MGRRYADTLDEGATEGFHRTVAHFRRHFAQRPVRMEQDVADGHPTVGFEPFVCSHPVSTLRQPDRSTRETPNFFCIENRIMIHYNDEPSRRKGPKISLPVRLWKMIPDCTPCQRSASVASRPQKEIKDIFGSRIGVFCVHFCIYSFVYSLYKTDGFVQGAIRERICRL